MGFPIGYTEDLIPKFFIYILSLLGLIRTSISSLFTLLGLSHVLGDPNSSWPDLAPEFISASAAMIRDLLPVLKFGDLGFGSGSGYGCAVCLHDFKDHEEIRRLRNCQHLFHKGCVDRWIDHDQKSCPLCRKPLVPDDMIEAFNERLWVSPSPILEFGVDFCPMNNCL